jgi:hypothetical protein
MGVGVEQQRMLGAAVRSNKVVRRSLVLMLIPDAPSLFSPGARDY